MKIITPHKKHSKEVEVYKDIKKDAVEMREMINNGGFSGKWKEAFAIAHAQVSENPYRFFVVHKDIAKELEGSIIINPVIEEKEGLVPFKEACMSYPYRDIIKTRRYNKIVVEYKTPKRFGLNTHRRELFGILAFIFQHEIDHFNGIDIYSKFKK
jgi:peptide deformylase